MIEEQALQQQQSCAASCGSPLAQESIGNTSSARTEELAAEDGRLIQDLSEKLEIAPIGEKFRNKKVEELAEDVFEPAGFAKLRDLLLEKGTFTINTERHSWRDVDGEEREVTICRAASTGMWPMGTNYWTRDNALIGARLAFLEPTECAEFANLAQVGKELLLSSLTIGSSRTQLDRFDSVITSFDPHFVQNQRNWPHIFLRIDNNLNGEHPESWSHKQDAWQMLGLTSLQAIEQKVITQEELTPKHLEFFGKIVPFLAKVRFFNSENSGSWEEIAAIRSSVIAWELMLIDKACSCEFVGRLRSIISGFDKYRLNICPGLAPLSVGDAGSLLIDAGLEQIAKMLPGEATAVARENPAYRGADSALIYLLQLGLPKVLAADPHGYTKKDNSQPHLLSKFWSLLQRNNGEHHPQNENEIEQAILSQILSLHQPKTGGMLRYHGDSYQRCGFFRNVSTQRLSELYGAPSGDATSDFTGRDEIIPQGPEAAWTHPVWQLSSWAGKRYRETGDKKYLEIQKKFFLEGLRTITAEEDWSIDQDPSGKSRVIPVPAFRIPECVISDRNRKGEVLYFPSPHTPLNWSVAEAIDAFVSMERSLRMDHP